MDLYLSYVLVFVLLIVPLSLSFLFHKQKPIGPNLPLGKTGWPIIGETLEFVSVGLKGRPEKFVNDRMRKHSAEIFKTSLAGEKMAVLCGPAGNKLLFSNENKLVKSWWPPTIEKITISSNEISSIEGTKKSRILTQEFLKPEALQKYVPVMDSMVRQHLEKEWIKSATIATKRQVVKVFPLAKELTFALSCRLFMSVEDPDHVAKFAHNFSIVTAGLLSVPINIPGTAFNCAMKAANRIRVELSAIIKQRRRNDQELTSGACPDLLSHLLGSADVDGVFLPEMQIADIILGFLIASHDTTSTVITFVIYYLADHPDVYAKVLNEQMDISRSKGSENPLRWEDIQKMKYSRNVVNEVLRLQPPSQGAFKQAIHDFTYAGYDIPKGWKIFWSVYSTHQDPKYFPSPEKFDPSRFDGNGPMPYTFIPFGGGPRMCPGSEFARLEVLIFMHYLVLNFKWEKVISNEKIIYKPSPIPRDGLPILLLPNKFQ